MAFRAYEVCRVVVLSVTRQTSHASDFVSAESHASKKPLFAGYAFLNRNNPGLNQKEVARLSYHYPKSSLCGKRRAQDGTDTHEERSLDPTTYAISIFENCTAFVQASG